MSGPHHSDASRSAYRRPPLETTYTLIGPLVNTIVGLPAASGKNTAILNGSLEQASAKLVAGSYFGSLGTTCAFLTSSGPSCPRAAAG
jgi:hypothetical protein